MNDAFLSLLGMARKAGKLTFGFNDTVAAGSRVKLAVAASNLSQKTEKELKFKLPAVNFIRTNYLIDELSHATGRTAGVIGITDDGFAAKADELLSGE